MIPNSRLRRTASALLEVTETLARMGDSAALLRDGVAVIGTWIGARTALLNLSSGEHPLWRSGGVVPSDASDASDAPHTVRAPIGDAARRVGLLAVMFDRPATVQERALVASLARHIGSHHARLRALERASALEAVRRAVTDEADPPEIMRVAVTALAAAFHAPLVSLYRTTPDDGLWLQHQVGYRQVFERLESGVGVMGRVARTGQGVFLPDVRADPDFVSPLEDVLSEVCVPIIVDQHVAAVLNVETRGVRLDGEDFALVEAVGAFVSVALTRAEREASLRALFTANPLPMWLYDERTLEIVEVNDAALRAYGYRRAAFLALGADRLRVRDLDARAGLALHRRADGTVIEVQLTGHHTRFAGRSVRLVIAEDVTARRRVERDLRRRAFTDPLTGLANRAGLLRALEDSCDGGGAFALALVDLDHFKRINDSLGHPVGDRVLEGVAARLQGAVRSAVAVARMGGDEFAVVASGSAARAPEQFGRRLVEAVAQAPYTLEGHTLHVSASVGVTCCPDDAREASALLRNADLALYRAKARGGNETRRFSPDIATAALERLQIEAALRGAPERGELSLVYQPLVDVRTLDVSGFEALLRWNHPQLGAVSPSRFVPVAEECRLMTTLGVWARERACQEALAWGETGLSLNVSALEAVQPAFVDTVLATLERTGFPPERLTLEFTEGTLMSEQHELNRELQRLRAAGVELSVDDFGTGYSNFAYLLRFPVSELKIDRAFVNDIDTSHERRALVGGLIALGHSVGLRVVAEGVERVAQREVLVELGCDRLQGFLEWPPVGADAVASRYVGDRLTANGRPRAQRGR